MPPTRRHFWCFSSTATLIAGVVIASGPTAMAKPDSASEINALIDQLAASTLAERDRATDELERYEGPLEATIRPRLVAGEITPEQAVRLETVLQFRFMESPRAALGVGFVTVNQANNRAQQIPVILDRVLAGFPCSKTLKPGDIIRVVDGFELPATGGGDRVRSAILSHLPNEELELMIERDGRRSFIRVPLGDYGRLNNGGPARITPPPALLKTAWTLRKARLGLHSPNNYSPLPCVTDVARSSLPNLPERKPPEIRAGGSPDNGATLLHMLRSRASSLNRNNIAAKTQARINIAQPAQRIPVRAQPLDSPKARAAQLQTQLAQARASRERHLRNIARDDIGRDQQRAAISALTLIEAQIATIKSDIAELNGQKKDARVKPQD